MFSRWHDWLSEDIASIYSNIVSISKGCSLYQAINRGINLIESGYIGVIGSGDTFIAKNFPPEFLRFLSSSLFLEKSPIIAASIIVSLSNKSSLIHSLKTSPFMTSLNMNICHPSLLLQKSHYIHLGLYNHSFRIASDHHFVMRLVYSDLYPLIFHYPIPLIDMSYGGLSTRISSKPKLFYETILIYIDLFPFTWPFRSLVFVSRNISSLVFNLLTNLFFHENIFIPVDYYFPAYRYGGPILR